MLHDLIVRNRSYRRFYQEEIIPIQTLINLVDLARLSASGANLQPLKYVLSCDAKKNAQIFSHLVWARYLADWGGPVEGERPSAYIILLGDTSIVKTFGCDHGIAAQSILLGAAEINLGGCMIASINREDLRRDLEIPATLEILLVIAIGKPKEEVVIDSLTGDGNIKYWRDSQNVHHVPKRNLNDLIVMTYGK
jgi:nitroreductase